MAYNFPVGYQPYYPQYQSSQFTQPTQQTPQQQSNLIWVQGEAGAKSYLVAPNNTVQLWDSERQTIYLKSADASGMPSMRILDYTIRSDASHNSSSVINANTEISRKDLDALQEQIDTIKNDIRTFKSTLDGGKESSHAKSDLRPDAK